MLHLVDVWNLGGVSRVVDRLAAWQATSGWVTHVAVGDVDDLALESDVLVVPELANSGDPRSLLLAAHAIRKLDAQLRPDVIHVHHRGLALAAMLGTGRSHRIVEHVHGPFDDHRWSSFRSPTLLAVGSGVFSMVVNDYGRPAERVLQVVNGVPDPGRRPVPQGERRVVAGLGRLSAEKGPDRFADVAALLGSRRRDVQFSWMGWGPLADDIAHRPLVRLEPPAADVFPYLQSASVLLSPSRRDSMTLALIEAMAIGRPVVATAVGSVPDVVVDGVTGRLVSADATTSEIAEAVEWVLEPERYEALADNARHRYERHLTADHMCRSVDAAYRAAGLTQ